MNKYPLSAELVQKLVGYLGTRPYVEVFEVVDQLKREVAEGMKMPPPGNGGPGSGGGDGTPPQMPAET